MRGFRSRFELLYPLKRPTKWLVMLVLVVLIGRAISVEAVYYKRHFDGDLAGSSPARSRVERVRDDGAIQRGSNRAELENTIALMEDAAASMHQVTVRCRSSLLTLRGEIAYIEVEEPFDKLTAMTCAPCPIVEQTVVLMVPPETSGGSLRVQQLGEFSIAWPPAKAGESVECTSFVKVGERHVVAGVVLFPSGERAPNALVRGCGAFTSTDIDGHFELDLWLKVDGAPCAVSASYQHGEAVVTSDLVTVNLLNVPAALRLHIPDYPQWAPAVGAGVEETCLSAAVRRDFLRREVILRPFPEVQAEMEMALAKMPPACENEDTDL